MAPPRTLALLISVVLGATVCREVTTLTFFPRCFGATPRGCSCSHPRRRGTTVDRRKATVLVANSTPRSRGSAAFALPPSASTAQRRRTDGGGGALGGGRSISDYSSNCAGHAIPPAPLDVCSNSNLFLRFGNVGDGPRISLDMRLWPRRRRRDGDAAASPPLSLSASTTSDDDDDEVSASGGSDEVRGGEISNKGGEGGGGNEDGGGDEGKLGLGSRVKRWWKGGDAPKVRRISVEESGDGKGDPAASSSREGSSALPEWLRKEQQERERLRRLAAENKASDGDTARSQPSSDAKDPKRSQSSSKLESLMKGMPSIDEILGSEGSNYGGDPSGDGQAGGGDDDVKTNPPSPAETLGPGMDEERGGSYQSPIDVQHQAESLRAAAKAGKLKKRLDELLKEANLDTTAARSSASPDNSPGMDDDDDEDERSRRTVDILNREPLEPRPTSVSEQRYRSFAKQGDDGTKRGEWEAFLKKERQLRKRAGLTESLKKSDAPEERSLSSKQNSGQPSATTPVTGEDSKPPVESGEPKQDSRDDADLRSPTSIADVLSSSNDGSYKFLYEEEDAEIDKLRPKHISAADQRYRSFAKKGEGRSEDKKDAWAAFLKKEQEMREKAGLTSYGDGEKGDEELPQAKKDDGSGFTVGNGDSEEQRNAPSPTYSSTKDSLSNDDDDQQLYEDEDDDVISDFDLPQQSTTSDQRYRSFASKGQSSSGSQGDRRAAWEEFQKKEQELREKLGVAFPVGQADLTTSRAEGSMVENAAARSPNPPFFTDDGKRKPQIGRSNVKELEALYTMSSADDPLESDSKLQSDIVQNVGADPHSAHNRAPPRTPFFEDYIDEDYIEEEEEAVDEEQRIVSDEYPPPRPYDLAAELFDRDPLKKQDRVEQAAFSAYETRRNDMLEYTELTVAELNLLFEHDPLARLVAINKPDSAFGAIFRFEGLLVDTTELQFEAWSKVASVHGFSAPSREDARLAQLMRADVAVRDLFYWTTDILESRDMALTHYEALQECFDQLMERVNATKIQETLPDTEIDNESESNAKVLFAEANATAVAEIFPVVEGATEWLEGLRKVEMPCAVISHLDRLKLDTLLNVTGLAEYFSADERVSSSCGYERESQEHLGASLRLQRRPDHCFVFDATPSSSVAAHEVDMHAVALMGLYPMYELSTADLTVPSFDELTLTNVRRLFGDKTFDPEVELETERPMVKPRKVQRWVEGDRE